MLTRLPQLLLSILCLNLLLLVSPQNTERTFASTSVLTAKARQSDSGIMSQLSNEQTHVVSDGTVKYSESLVTGWENLTFDDSTWQTVVAPSAGLCNPSIARRIPNSTALPVWGQNPQNHQTIYARKIFDAQAPAVVNVQTLVDDDFDLYVNGTLVRSDRDGIEDGVHEDDVSSLILNGQNLIAIMAIDSAGGCQHLAFDMTIVEPSYSISGRVTDDNNNAASGITISDGAGHSTNTDANGNYTLSGLAADTYTLTPSKNGYIFSPPSRNVTVPPDATGQDFVGTLSRVPLLKQGISPYNDNNPTWEGLEYDHGNSQSLRCGKTIASCGCATTSIAMILRSYGVVNPTDGSASDPKSVNDYFNRNTQCNQGGCVSLGYAYGDVRWTAVGGYSQEANSNYGTQKIIYDGDGGGGGWGTLAGIVSQDINSDRPVILWDKSQGHWFVATGISGNTFTINDPLYTRTRLDDSAYGNTADAIRRYKKTSSDFSSIEVPVLAPAQVLITDPNGKRTGYDPISSTVVKEIPNSIYYFSQALRDETGGQPPPPENAGIYWAIVSTPQAGKYQVQIIAPSNQVYSFAIYGSEIDATTTLNAFEGTPMSGTNETYEISYAPDQPIEIQRTAENQDPNIQYNGWRGLSDASANSGTYRVSNTKNDTATFKFTGTSVKWISLKGPDQGKAQVTIDGVNKGTFDLYRSTQSRFTKTFKGLANGKHKIVIKVLGIKNANATDTKVVLDAFVVGNSTMQDNASAVQYNKWSGKTNASASGGSYRTSNKPSANARFTFTGTTVDWITAKGPKYGKAKVLIDGVAKGDFDLYGGAQQWQVAISFTGLSDAQHTIEIKPLGSKNSASGGKNVVVDAFRGPFTAIGE